MEKEEPKGEDSEANSLECFKSNEEHLLKLTKMDIWLNTKRKAQEGWKLSPAHKEFLEKMKEECTDHESNEEHLLKLKKMDILLKTKRKAQEGRKLSPADKEFLEKMKEECTDRDKMNLLEEILQIEEVKVLEEPPLDPREKEDLEEMKRKVEELKAEAKVLKRRMDFLHLLLSYPMEPKSDKQILPRLRRKFSSINQQIRKFETSILEKHYSRFSFDVPEDINKNIQELFCDVDGKLAKNHFYIGAFLPQDMVEFNKHDTPDTDIELKMPPTSTKSENVTRPYQDEFLNAPQVIQKLAINSAVHQILKYFTEIKSGRIGIFGSGWVELAKALKDLPSTRNMFDVVQCVSLSQQQSIIELQMNIAEQAHTPAKIHTYRCSHCTRVLLLVDYIDQQMDLHDLDFADGSCVALNTRSQKFDEIMAVDLEIRMEDHLLPWKYFCKTVGRILDHSSPLQQKAIRLIEECHGHLLAIILLAGALKDVTDIDVWELALHELTWQPLSHDANVEELARCEFMSQSSSHDVDAWKPALHKLMSQRKVQGMSVVMVNVLRFIWQRMGTPTKNCIKYCSSHDKGKEIDKVELIYYGITNGWLQTRDEGEHILEELTTSFLIENASEGTSVRMREKIRLVLLNIFIPGKDPAYLNQGDLGLTETPKSEEWGAREINLMNNKLYELPESPTCPFLVKLFLQGNYDLMVIPPSFFERMPVLQVLDLSYTSIKSLPPSISSLVALREFFLRGCDLLMKLPPEIGALANLEVFDLEGTEIMYLPKEIGELVSLKSLKVSFNGYANLYKGHKDVNTIIPRMALPNLTQLNELSIDVHPNGDWWDVEVRAIINELCNLRKLRILNLYMPVVELLKDLRWGSTSLIYPALTHFRFIVGYHEQRLISRLSHEVEDEFNKLEKGLKYINGEGLPTEITKALKHANAFFLERHWTVKNLSEFGIENMDKLKFCLLAECNEFQSIIDIEHFYQEECDSDSDESEHNSDFNEEIVLGSLQYLSIHYMKNMESICKAPVQRGCLSNLKYLALHTCPSLITVFTLGMLGNLINLKELIVEDCPKINSLISMKSSSLKLGYFLPSLKKISLLELPELISISSGLCIAPKLERLVVFYCPKLERLSTMEVSSTDMKVIKGENEWWDSLKRNESLLSRDHQDYLAGIFVPLRKDGDLMDQLAKH